MARILRCQEPYNHRKKKKDEPCSLAWIWGIIGRQLCYLNRRPGNFIFKSPPMSREICNINFYAARTQGREWTLKQVISASSVLSVHAYSMRRVSPHSLLLVWICPGSNHSTSQHRVWERNCSVLVALFIPPGWREPHNNLPPQFCSPGSISLQSALILNRRERWQRKKTFPSEQCLFPRACHNTKHD